MQVYRGDFERTATHWWWRTGWNPETRYLTFHLTFGAELAVAEAAQRYVGVLGALGNVGPVPQAWLHLTMTGVGFAAEVPPEAVESLSERILVDAASRADGSPPLVFDTFFLGREGVSLTGPAPDWLTALKDEQVQAVDELLTPGDWAAFHPHVSLAYFAGEVDEAALLAGVAEAGLADVVVTRPTLSLLELRREGHLYTWRVLGERILELSAGQLLA
ncbi:MAG: hypothetical protein VB080_03770 [Propionicimonas sp.]|uniref:2'-5' RNA ligase family protein n=1 Tax=Propionicimonas sp. TaxID=1955623 RepID=UPI002B1E9CBD|nr:2'-5' RNA ligase family protein [Propionicimonas sp.]MEA4943536.1 hypothetical protein [Propionicimonas sp.]MEA5055507.1 hypothetical protein [Propionicimonas sp.]MEA5117356.1 hypothetical protein [Propionicimonas sp.]